MLSEKSNLELAPTWLGRLIASPRTGFLLPVLAGILFTIALYFSFIVAPNEQTMGAVQRIFYMHVGCATATYLCVFVLLGASLAFLASGRSSFDALAHAGASAGTLFSSIVLGTGMIWGHSAWNTWWRWEPRLVSFLVMWLMLCCYLLLRVLLAESSVITRFGRNACAALGILIAANIPIVIASVRLLKHTEQLHPQVVGRGGLSHPAYVTALLLFIAAEAVFALWLMLLKYSNLIAAERIVMLEGEIKNG